MRVYHGNGLGDMYYRLLRDITTVGREIVTRGHRCLELPWPVTLIYEKPGYCWMQIPGRKFNPFFALAEVVWILMGSGDVEWISYFNSQMRNFQDGNNPEFHGAYGLRIRKWTPKTFIGEEPFAEVDQINHVVKKLQEDPFSRQAVISLWDPIRDNIERSKDHPCNNVVYFSLRKGVLDMTVVIRSNDVVWGTPYNAVQFTHILAYVAGRLGVEMGKTTYVIQNLHYYFDLYKPTLANLLDHAFDEKEELSAETCPLFRTADDIDFGSTQYGVRHTLERWRGDNAWSVHSFVHPFHGVYWQGIIPTMVWVYTVLHEKKASGEGDAKFIADHIVKMGQPFIGLIQDFYVDTKDLFIKSVMVQCQKILSAQTVSESEKSSSSV